MMKSIVCGTNSNSAFSNGFSFGVNNFNYVYERMVDKLFSNIKDISEYYPSGEWHLDCFENSFESSNLRPDTIIKINNRIYILDAKNYRFGTTHKREDLPSTSSIQKQITYGEYLVQCFSFDSVVNAFILPYDMESNSFGLSNPIECIGYSSAKWKSQTNDYEYVFTILLDTNFLIMNWNKNDNSVRRVLIDLLDKRLSDTNCSNENNT